MIFLPNLGSFQLLLLQIFFQFCMLSPLSGSLMEQVLEFCWFLLFYRSLGLFFSMWDFFSSLLFRLIPTNQSSCSLTLTSVVSIFLGVQPVSYLFNFLVLIFPLKKKNFHFFTETFQFSICSKGVCNYLLEYIFKIIVALKSLSDNLEI